MYSSSLLEVSGKAATSYYGFLAPTLFGKTTLQLTDSRIIERTRKTIHSRYCEVPLSKVDSVEIAEDGMSWLLVLGFFTLALYGLGLVFFLLYFFVKYKYLIVRSGSNVQVLCIQGGPGMERAREFMAAVLQQTERHFQRS